MSNTAYARLCAAYNLYMCKHMRSRYNIMFTIYAPYQHKVCNTDVSKHVLIIMYSILLACM